MLNDKKCGKLVLNAHKKWEWEGTFSLRLSAWMWDPIIKTPAGTDSSLVLIKCVSTPAMNFSISLRNTTSGPFLVSSVANCKKKTKTKRHPLVRKNQQTTQSQNNLTIYTIPPSRKITKRIFTELPFIPHSDNKNHVFLVQGCT